MKKIAVILSLILCFSTVTAYSEDSLKQEILYRDFPWYSTYSEINDSMFTDSLGVTIEGQLELDIDIDTFACTLTAAYPSELCVKEGGMSVSYFDVPISNYRGSATAYYIYPLDDNGIVRDYNMAQLIMGEYEIYGLDNMEEVYNELFSALTALYGVSIPLKKDTLIIDTWFDEQVNMVSMLYIDPYGLIILYGANHIDEKLAEYQEFITDVPDLQDGIFNGL